MELGSEEIMNVPIWIIFGFQQQEKQGAQNLNNDTLSCLLLVLNVLLGQKNILLLVFL